MRQFASVRIERPVDLVFSYTEDPLNAPRWADGIVRFEITKDEPAKVGTRYRLIIREGSRENAYDGEVLVWEPNRLTRNRVQRGVMAMVMDRHYRAMDGGTVVTMTVEVELRGFGRLLVPLVWAANGYFLRKQASKLKQALEAAPLVAA